MADDVRYGRFVHEVLMQEQYVDALDCILPLRWGRQTAVYTRPDGRHEEVLLVEMLTLRALFVQGACLLVFGLMVFAERGVMHRSNLSIDHNERVPRIMILLEPECDA